MHESRHHLRQLAIPGFVGMAEVRHFATPVRCDLICLLPVARIKAVDHAAQQPFDGLDIPDFDRLAGGLPCRFAASRFVGSLAAPGLPQAAKGARSAKTTATEVFMILTGISYSNPLGSAPSSDGPPMLTKWLTSYNHVHAA